MEKDQQTYKLPGLYYFSAQLLQPVSLSLRVKINEIKFQLENPSNSTPGHRDSNNNFKSFANHILKLSNNNYDEHDDDFDESGNRASGTWSNEKDKKHIRRQIQVDNLTIYVDVRRLKQTNDI